MVLVVMKRWMRYIIGGILAAVVAFSAMPSATAENVAVPAPSRQSPSHRSQQSGTVIAEVRIPAIDLHETVRAGVSLDVIDQGVAYWAGTALPGEDGNFVLAGHRTTFTAPFRDLDRLRSGDLIFVTDDGGFEVMYRVTDTLIVQPEDIWITYNVGTGAMATLFACHPKGSARQRIVVQAELVADGKVA